MSEDVPHYLIPLLYEIKVMIHGKVCLVLFMVIMLPYLSHAMVYKYGEEVYLPNSTVIDEKGNIFLVEESFYPEPGFYRTENTSFYVVDLRTSKKVYLVGEEVEIIANPSYAFSSIKVNGSVSKRKFIAGKPGYYEIEAEVNDSKLKEYFLVVDKDLGVLNISGELRAGNKIRIIASDKAGISIIHKNNAYLLRKKREFIIPEEGEYTIKAEINIGKENLTITKKILAKPPSLLEVPEKVFAGEEVQINFSNCKLSINNQSIANFSHGFYSLYLTFNKSGVKEVECNGIKKKIIVEEIPVIKTEIINDMLGIFFENYTGKAMIIFPSGNVYMGAFENGTLEFYPEEEGRYNVILKNKTYCFYFYKKRKKTKHIEIYSAEFKKGKEIKVEKINDKKFRVRDFIISVTNGNFDYLHAEGAKNIFVKFKIRNVTRGGTALFISSPKKKIESIEYVKFKKGKPYVYKDVYVANNIAAIYLEDGGEGDEDGVKNGVIVDPGIIITGQVYEDLPPLGSNSGEDIGKAGVRVRLFKDNGDLTLNNSDYLKLETYTNTSGYFKFEIEEPPWWDSSWNLRREIIITSTNNLTLTNYPVKITLNTGELINESKLRNDCGDLRFVDSQGNKLNYWIKPGTCNTSSTEIWVNVTEIKNNTQSTIYVYYNNSNATSESDAESVFYFYDDFENGLGKWTVYDGFNNFWRLTDYRSYEGNYSAAYNHQPPTPPDFTAGSQITRGYLRSDTFYLGEHAFIFWKEWTETEKTGYSEPPTDIYDNMYFYVSTNGGSTWNLLKRWEDSSLAWVSRSVNLSNYQSSNARVQFYFDSADALYNDYEGWYIDNVVIRKYQPPEPVASVQGEESRGEIINGTYFVAVEASSITPEYWNGMQAIPEQTYGSRYLNSLETYSEFGGKNPFISDNWSPGVYEHYGMVNETTLVNVSNLNFGFSFSVVVNNASDGQGSLRQVIRNANAIDNKTNVSFVMQTPSANGKWRININSDLPTIKSSLTLDNSSIVLNAFSLNRTLKLTESDIIIRGIKINGTGKGIFSTSIVSEDNALPFGEKYVRRILINNSQNPNPLDDYQINFTIDTQSLIADGKLRSDCGDIRFIDPITESELSYYVMNCNAPDTTIWVRVPQVSGYGKKIIYLYYGNLSLDSKSSGEETFDFFEDWENGINSSKWSRGGSSISLSPYWNTYTSVGSITPYEGNYFAGSVNLGILRWVTINSTISPSTPSILTFYWRVNGASSNRAKLEFIYGTTSIDSITGTTSWLRYDYEISNPKTEAIKWKYSTNWNAGGNNRGFLDLIFLRKYLPPEPVVTVSDELPLPERPENILIENVEIDVNDTAISIEDVDGVYIRNVSTNSSRSLDIRYSSNNSIDNSTFKCPSNSSCIYILNTSSSNFSNIEINSQDWGIEINSSEGDIFSNILFLSSYPTLVSFEYSGNLKLKAVEYPPNDPQEGRNIKRYINITNTSSNTWIFVNFSYNDSDVIGDESKLKVWKYNTTWYEEGWNGARVLDTINNIVGVNITDFGSVFAPICSGLKILGRIFEDFPVLGIRDLNDTGIANVTVALFRDINNNDVFDSSDTLIAETLTNSTGFYNFTIPYSTLNHFVVVDSKSVNTTRGVNPTWSMNNIWAEQTFVVEWNDSKNTHELMQRFGGENLNKSDNFGIFFFDDFETWKGWVNYSSGVVSQSSEESYVGKYSLKKSSFNDPNGGYKLLKSNVGRGIILEGYTYRPSSWSGGAIDRIGVEDNNFNGYTFRVHHFLNYISIDRRTSGIATEISSRVSWNPPEDEWYFWRLVLYDNGTIAFSTYYTNGTLAASVSTTDNTYSNFDRVVVHGGYEYYVDNLCLKLINANYEHIARINTTTYSNESIDFGFSFDVIVNSRDADDEPSKKFAQGTLRQFIENADAITGEDRSYFVEVFDEIVVNDSLTSGGLLQITDDFTILNGSVFYSNMSLSPVKVTINSSLVSNGYGLRVVSAKNITIADINIKGASNDGILFSYVNDSRVEGVTLFNNGISGDIAAIYLSHSSNNVIIRCNASYNLKGIQLDSNSNNNIVEECFTSNNTDHGIYVWGSENNLLINNTVIDNGYYGIYAQDNSHGNVIHNNTVIGSIRSGIYVENSENCSIKYNVIKNNNKSGIEVGGSRNVYIYNNTISKNLRGILIYNYQGENSYNVTIIKNCIYNNTYLGIDLSDYLGLWKGDNVTLNDGYLNSSQPNYGIDYPVINFSAFFNNKLYIKGFINNETSTQGSSSFANSTVELYLVNHNGEGDNFDGNNGYGEGYYYIGSLVADAHGNFEGSFTIDLTKVNAGDNITATTTLNSYGTSEFGKNFISAWAFYFGNLSSDFILANMLMQNMTKWEEAKKVNLVIYAENSDINFSALQALGKDSSGSNSSNDFVELDNRLSMSSLVDNVKRTYSKDGSTAIETRSFYINGREIKEVPVVKSIFDEDFKTGILWDTSDCSSLPCEYDGSQDVVFITEINPNIGFQGEYHDYEIRVPVNLQYMNGGNRMLFYIVSK